MQVWGLSLDVRSKMLIRAIFQVQWVSKLENAYHNWISIASLLKHWVIKGSAQMCYTLKGSIQHACNFSCTKDSVLKVAEKVVLKFFFTQIKGFALFSNVEIVVYSDRWYFALKINLLIFRHAKAFHAKSIVKIWS